MDKENMKNMIVLKNLPSNIVDEAMVILKPNIKLKSLDTAEKNKNAKTINTKDQKKYIINEAEMIVSNYISSIENNKKKSAKTNKKIETKYKRLKMISIFLGIMFVVSILIK